MARSSLQRKSISYANPTEKPQASVKLRLASRNGTVVHEKERVHRRPQTDAQLVARAQAGDQRAFEMLVIKHQKRLIHLASRFVGEGDAQDVAQIAFIKAWRNLKSFKGESQFYTWLYRIAINTAKNELAKSSRHQMKNQIDVMEAEEVGHLDRFSDFASPDSFIIADETKAAIGKAVKGMKPFLREVITLREIDGLSYDEIAEIQSVPVGTVRSRIFRARFEIDSAMTVD